MNAGELVDSLSKYHPETEVRILAIGGHGRGRLTEVALIRQSWIQHPGMLLLVPRAKLALLKLPRH